MSEIQETKSPEQYIEGLTFAKRAFGGCDEEDVLCKMKELNECYRAREEELCAKHIEEIDAIKQEKNEKIQQVKEELQEQLTSQVREQNEQLQKITEEHTIQQKQLKEQYEKQIQKLEEDMKGQKEKLRIAEARLKSEQEHQDEIINKIKKMKKQIEKKLSGKKK